MQAYKSNRFGQNEIVEAIKRHKTRFIVIIAVIAAVIITIAAVINLTQNRNFSSSFLVSGDVIKIGIRTDIERFGQMEEDGTITGFDRDVIDEALNRILPAKERLIEFVSITSQDAGANIKYGVTNINLGLIVADSEKTSGFRISDSYYEDNVVAVVQGSSRLDKISNMEGGRLGVFQSVLPDNSMSGYLSKNKMEFDTLRYSDYESAITDLEHNRVNAIIMPYAMARQFEQAGLRVLAEPLFTVAYSVMLPTNQAAFCTELNKALAEMRRDGTLDELAAKWNL